MAINTPSKKYYLWYHSQKDEVIYQADVRLHFSPLVCWIWRGVEVLSSASLFISWPLFSKGIIPNLFFRMLTTDVTGQLGTIYLVALSKSPISNINVDKDCLGITVVITSWPLFSIFIFHILNKNKSTFVAKLQLWDFGLVVRTDHNFALQVVWLWLIDSFFLSKPFLLDGSLSWSFTMSRQSLSLNSNSFLLYFLGSEPAGLETVLFNFLFTWAFSHERFRGLFLIGILC